jgi:hypothetical protein
MAVLVLSLGPSLLAAGSTRKAVPGDPLDIAPFGLQETQATDAARIIRWPEPRKIRQVLVEFEGRGPTPELDQIRLQYWHRVWDGKADPLILERGAGGVGWDAMDDWTNGKWITAKVQVRRSGRCCEFTFLPTSGEEIPGLKGEPVPYRKTLGLRLCCEGRMPAVSTLGVYTESVCRPIQVRVQFGRPRVAGTLAAGPESGRMEVFNGQVLALRPARGSPVSVRRDGTWVLQDPAGAAVEADLIMAADPIDGRYDRTIVTVRSSTRPFSFAADEVAAGDRILIDDLGVLVTRSDDPISLEDYRQALVREYGGQTVYDRVAAAEEQTLGRAWNDMPVKRPVTFVHGLPGNRNAMRQWPNGEIEITSHRRWFDLQRSPRDSDRKLWDGELLRISAGLPAPELRGGRQLREGFLPVLRTWWQDGQMAYEQKTVLTAAVPDLNDVGLDTPTVLLMQVRVVNLSAGRDSQEGITSLRFGSNAGHDEPLTMEGDRIVATVGGQDRLRLLAGDDGKGAFSQDGPCVCWKVTLGPGQASTLQAAIPSVTLREEGDIEAIRALRFDSEADRVCAFWRQLISQGSQIQTPEPWINDFYKAQSYHLMINCLKELGTDFLHAHVGTFNYGVYPSESVMMISDLDRRGFHRLAQRNYDAFLHYQGTVAMPGNFGSAEGEFYGAGGHETGGYNKSHGYVIWGMAQHWWLTRDRDWMGRSAAGMVKACDWVIRERKATQKVRPDGSRPLEYGWLPAGSLEDVTDYWHWLATNSATVWGFRDLADALADFGHPEAGRLQQEARSYTEDFMRGITEARILCPVVRLRDGTYVPKIPSRLYERGRSHGWIRETLEGPLFLAAYGLLSPDAAETRWVLKDYEDNLYISDRYGYSIANYDAFWFSRGGFSMQANLLDGPLPYLWRDDVKHFLRAYFNGFASAFYPEVRMCNEHSLPELGYPAGDLFKTSDESQSTYWLRLMFVNEQGQDLYLGQAIPRYWLAEGNTVAMARAPSRFGPLSIRYTSHTATGTVQISLDPPVRNQPRTLYLRIRHPESRPLKAVLLNGQPYNRFDPAKEWIILSGTLAGPQEIVARYE